MTDPQLFYVIILGSLTLYLGYRLYTALKYQRYMARPFPGRWHSILEKNLPIFTKLPPDLVKELEDHVKHFLYTKKFVGCADFEITDEVRVTIAAEACLLILNRPTTRYKNLGWIYVYPSTFVAQREAADEYGVVSTNRAALLGESWQNGRIVLAWDSVQRGIKNFDDGHNVVLHEFAHQLDQEDGAADGAPLLYNKDSYQIWAKVFSNEYLDLQKKLKTGRRTLIDEYGATNPAEFFAVVTELFFEKPAQLREKHPELFAEMESYYRVCPEDWRG